MTRMKPATQAIEFIDLQTQQARIRDRIDAAIARVLDHGQYIMGPEVEELEKRLAAHNGAKHAISCASGTDALLIAMMSWGIGPGDAVLCPDFTYTATPETIALLGATPVLVDVHYDTYNVDPVSIKDGIAAAHSHGLNPKAIIVVDLFGLPANYDEIVPLAKQNNILVLADAAQSFGALYKGKPIGRLGDITTTSFFPAKPLGCYGDGGAIFTDNDELAEVMRSIRLHGKGADKYDIVRIGVNGRLDTIQAAILLEKIEIFSEEVESRRIIASHYCKGLQGSVGLPYCPDGCLSVWAQYTIRHSERDKLARLLAEQGIPCNIYYPRPIHEQPAYRHYPVAHNGTPNATRLAREVLSLPMHPYLDSIVADRIIAAIRNSVQI